ncbi:MAG: acyl-CoA dehydrogenase family protein [Paracoccaceae bacterium]|nr:acyl-CoA dehydrogenase family protein [Paracoccaceae bacterium]
MSGGDQDVSHGILHLVLARSSAEGLGGLSLFICKSSRSDGTRNGVNVTRIEEKLGIHASPTCQLRFDAAEAELLGVEGQGLAAMFTMMNHARLSVALQGVAHAARATGIARSYAQDRIQGKSTSIAQHPDVARMLDEMDLRAVGARGIAHLALVMMETDNAPDLVEVLTPIAKYFCTEAASQAADIGIQVLGGYGYLEEYGMAQILRDARICRIYEGANGIHALSLATRLMRMRAPLEALDAFATECPPVKAAHTAWQSAWHDLETADDARPLADAFMNLTAELVHQIVWARIAITADQHPNPARMRRLAARSMTRFDVQLSHYSAEMMINPREDAKKR